VTIVNHITIDIAATRDALWQAILEDYVTGDKFGSAGYAVESLDDDPGAVLGGYRMKLEKDGAVVDDRIVRITERDDEARRLSLCADYLTIPGGFKVCATYQAQDSELGTRYALDCHTLMTLEAPAGGAGSDIPATLAETHGQFQSHLADFFQRIKARLEAAA
jgi:hypothetical protein